MSDWAGIKYALNSTLGTEGFQSLDKLISIRLAEFESAMKTPKYIWSKPGTYDWTVPDGIYKIYVTACGGGGGGGGCLGDIYTRPRGSGGGGGGGAAVFNRPVYVTPGDTASIIIGRGGSGGQSSISTSVVKDGGDGRSTALIMGDATALRPTLSLPGGNGGSAGNGTKAAAGGAAGASGGGNGGNGYLYKDDRNTYARKGSDGIIGKGGGVSEMNHQDYGGGGGGSLGNGGIQGRSLGSDEGEASPTFGGGGSGGNATQNNASGQMNKGQDGADGYMLISFVEIDPSEIVAATSTASALTYTEPQLMNEYSKGVETIG